MDNDNFRILKVLSEKEKMNYRNIVLKLRLHPKTVRVMLNRLIKNGLVKEEGRANWKRGKRLWYSLTEKGRGELMNEAVKRVNEGLKIVLEFSSMLLIEDSRLEEWRRAAREAIMNVRVTEDMPLEERIRRVEDKAKQTFGLLTEAYKNMHELMVKIFCWKPHAGFTPNPMKIFIGFNKYGGIYFIPAKLLKEGREYVL